MERQKSPAPLEDIGTMPEAASEKVSPRHRPQLKLRHQSNCEHESEPAACRSEIGDLALIKPRRCEQNLASVSVEPDGHLALDWRAVKLDHQLAGRSKNLRNISATRNVSPYAFGHLIAAIDHLDAMAGQRFEKQMITADAYPTGIFGSD